MRSAVVALVAAATAASAQTTSISFFYPAEEPSYDEYSDIALSVIEVQDADHTVVAFSCLGGTTTTSADWPYSTSNDFDSDSDSYYSSYDYYNDCVFAGGALTATVGPDSFAYTTVFGYDNYYGGEYDYTLSMGCTSGEEAAFCTIQSAGAEAWSEYCSYTADLPYDDDEATSSCISNYASSTLPASTSALQASEITTIAMTVTAGADKLSAGASATGTGAKATSTSSHISKFTVTGSVAGGATTTIGGPSGSAGATSSGAAPAQQTDNAAAGKLRAAGAMGVVGGVVAALAL
ncbi:hypothetical protein UCDDS831_g08206 [Diplodia seriata]|uniref:Uncharacterized protein n=1 Tax=Diplodia seriata TaxID=420778 RepID=A0A0G2DWL9_9PEZI|nr:hypothetical protein UCDDS831_g08206 [Diplodia seriata]